MCVYTRKKRLGKGVGPAEQTPMWPSEHWRATLRARPRKLSRKHPIRGRTCGSGERAKRRRGHPVGTKAPSDTQHTVAASCRLGCQTSRPWASSCHPTPKSASRNKSAHTSPFGDNPQHHKEGCLTGTPTEDAESRAINVANGVSLGTWNATERHK